MALYTDSIARILQKRVIFAADLANMTKVDVLYIQDSGRFPKAILCYGKCCHIHLYKTKSYTWITISIKGSPFQQALIDAINSLGDSIDITYITYAGTTTLKQVPKLVRQQADGDWRYFKLRI